jgi:hypothetical protein
VLHPPVWLDVSLAFDDVEEGGACIVAGEHRFTVAAANDYAQHLLAAVAAAEPIRQLRGAEE